jgi:hypothetical protein
MGTSGGGDYPLVEIIADEWRCPTSVFEIRDAILNMFGVRNRRNSKSLLTVPVWVVTHVTCIHNEPGSSLLWDAGCTDSCLSLIYSLSASEFRYVLGPSNVFSSFSHTVNTVLASLNNLLKNCHSIRYPSLDK